MATVKAKKVKEGDFLPGLGNGYVFEDSQPAEDVFCYSGYMAGAISEYMQVISYHNEAGDECYLIVPRDERVEVSR